MPLQFEGDDVRFEGVCVVEEALALTEHWRERSPGTADLSACTHLHTTLIQVLATAAPSHVVPPSDQMLSRWLGPILKHRTDKP